MITRCNSESLSVYVHFPFCKRKCTYCDFASYEGMEHRIPTYMEALKKEIIEKSAEFEKRKIYTVYFGGGTPTYPDSGWIQKIMNLLKESFDCSFCEESTLEANPGTVTPESLKKYKEAGFNRLSIGLQSANDRELEKAGRIHRYRDFLESYKYARNAGFTNINVDLIFGFPWQSYQDWKNSVDTLVSLNPEHISCYDLILEEGTPLFNQIQKGEYVMISDSLNREMYYYVCDTLKKNGYRQYEISNFAKPGFESKHNTVYWKTLDYIGFGAGAYSFVNGIRYGNTDDIEEYIGRIKKDGNAVIQREALSFEDRMNEYAMLGFRMTDGIDMEEFFSKFGVRFSEYYNEKILMLTKEGFIEIQDKKVRLSRKGLDFANLFFMEFI
jgi:oxygen-independent coproporphyrinogen-3 oxidase